jgi:putative aldouronate transport system substrate-binding protein
MKQFLLKFSLIIAALALILSACTPAAPTEPPANQATEAPEVAAPTALPTEPPAPTPEAPVDLEIWVSGRVTEAGPPPEDWVAYDIIKNDLNINLKVVLLPGTQSDQDTKINTAAASNSLPDLFFVNRDSWYKITEAGLTANVDELLPLMPERTKTHYSDPNRNNQVTYNGSLYGLADPGNLVQTDAMVIRQDWLDKLGLEAPKTLDDFLAVAKAFTNDDPDGNGQKDTYGMCAFIDGSGLNAAGLGPRFDFVYGAYGVAGTWNLTSKSDFGLNVRNPNYMKATEFIRTLNEEGVINPDWPTLKKDDFRVGWKQGKCGMMQENFAALSTKSNYADFDANFPDGEWVPFDPPTGPDGDSSAGVTLTPARIYAVSQKAMDEGKGPAVARLLEWMATDGYMLLAFGQEGVNYNLDANGYVSTEGLDDAAKWTAKEAQPLTQLANMVYIFSDIELQARYPAYKAESGREMAPLDYYNAFGKQAYTNSSGAAVINPPANAADFVRFYSENIVQFVLGQKPLTEEAWAEYIAGLDSLGAKDLEASALQTLIDTGFIE